jgi:ataxia telangiectasia mutated family protein
MCGMLTHVDLARYHPTDVTSEWFSGQLKAKRAECGKGSLSLQPVIDLFLSLRKKFRPVMRHYFTERHKNPIAWFAMRLSYTRSVATTSIVGHVLGLGDRHLSNILLDAVTGEVVHIDLGIAFDQVSMV